MKNTSAESSEQRSVAWPTFYPFKQNFVSMRLIRCLLLWFGSKRQYPSESESPCNKCCVCFFFYFCLWNVYRHKFIENIVCKDLNTFSTFQYKEVVRSVLIKHKLKLTYFSLLQLIHQQCSTKSNIIDRGEKPIKLMHRSSNRKINHIMIYLFAAH